MENLSKIEKLDILFNLLKTDEKRISMYVIPAMMQQAGADITAIIRFGKQSQKVQNKLV